MNKTGISYLERVWNPVRVSRKAIARAILEAQAEAIWNLIDGKEERREYCRIARAYDRAAKEGR